MSQRNLFQNNDDFAMGAEFSPCRKHRYVLWRRWNWQGYANQVMFIGLNPSVANETDNDRTLNRCIGFAKAWGFGGMLMMNAFAIVETDRKLAMGDPDRLGPGNDEALSYRSSQVGMIVAAWGADCPVEREQEICELLQRPIHCIEFTKERRPKHPLYIRADAQPQLFWEPSKK